MASQSAERHRAAILALVGTSGSLSRTEIAQRLGMSPATVTQLTKELIAQGSIQELASAPSSGGRPAQLLGLPGPTPHALGVKVAPGHLAIADVALDGAVRSVAVHDFDPKSADAFGYLTDTVLAVVEERAGGAGPLLGVGVGVPGGVKDPGEGIVHADLLGWHDLPLGKRLRHSLGLPVLVDNDVNALAVGECLYGRGRAQRDFLIVTIGVGIGAAIIARGSVYRGAHGDAGELGHTPAALDGPLCVCGNRGCLEAIVGDHALLAAAHRDEVLAPDRGIEDLREAADRGDPAAQEIFRDAGEVLGRSVAGLVNVTDPESVVIYGEGVPAWQHWHPGFESTLRAHLPPVRNGIPVEVDRWDDRTWVQGAAALVMSIPFDTTETAGEQGRLIRAQLIEGRAAEAHG